MLPAEDGFAIRIDKRLSILVTLGNPCLPKVLLSQYVNGKLGPMLRGINVVKLEDRGSVRIANLGRTLDERETIVGALAAPSESPFNSHSVPPWRGMEPVSL
jgi:hypothetical protein